MRPDGSDSTAAPAPGQPVQASPALTSDPLLTPRRSRRGAADLRRSRAGEMARLLPLLGLVLFILPLLGSNDRSTGPTGIWLFACWAGLILVAALLAPRLTRDLDPGGDGWQDGK